MMGIVNEIRNGKRYVDGINEIIYNNKLGSFQYKNVFRGKWLPKTDAEVEKIIQEHQGIETEFISR